jgi:hypothetical protein
LCACGPEARQPNRLKTVIFPFDATTFEVLSLNKQFLAIRFEQAAMFRREIGRLSKSKSGRVPDHIILAELMQANFGFTVKYEGFQENVRSRYWGVTFNVNRVLIQ